jgi:Ca-activated chloride channel family protein
MRWAEPQLLELLWGVPVLLLLFAWAERRRNALARALGRPEALERLTSETGPGRRALRAVMILLAVSLGVIGLARPQAGFRLTTTTSRGVDLVLAIDVSQSMAARDQKPDRLGAARRESVALLQALEGSPVGVVEFAGEARLVSPLSTDREGLASVVETAEIGDVGRPGTDVGAAVRLAATLLRRPGDRPRAIVLVSDGENLSGDPRAGLAAAREAGARLFAIGIGTPEGSIIPLVDSTGNVTGAKHDASGQLVKTRLDERLLVDLARRGGGRYERGDGTGRAALRLVDPLRSEGEVEAHGRAVRTYDERYQWFAAAAGLLLVAERIAPRRRRA